MSQPPAQPEKRVVPKGEYVRHLFSRITILLCILFFSSLFILSTGSFLLKGFRFTQDLIWNGSQSMTLSRIVGLIAGLVWLNWYFKIAKAKVTKLQQMERVEPLTRQNTGRLPVEESLVRASSAPTEEQETILLRAAQAAPETPPEQLLRPSASGNRTED